jgi:hypothetical protein
MIVIVQWTDILMPKEICCFWEYVGIIGLVVHG